MTDAFQTVCAAAARADPTLRVLGEVLPLTGC